MSKFVCLFVVKFFFGFFFQKKCFAMLCFCVWLCLSVSVCVVRSGGVDLSGLKVMQEESPVGASAANAVIERSVWEMQNMTRSLVAYAELVHSTTFSGQVVSRFQRSVSHGKTAYERRKQKHNRKAMVPFGELVMFMPMEKPKDKGEIRNCVGIMLGGQI